MTYFTLDMPRGLVFDCKFLSIRSVSSFLSMYMSRHFHNMKYVVPGDIIAVNTGFGDNLNMQEITASELKSRLDAGDDIQLIDVRQPDEYAFAKIDGAKLIPLGEIISRMSELDETRETVVHCKMGGRSARAIEVLQASGYTGSLANLVGGITAWSNDVDPTVPKY